MNENNMQGQGMNSKVGGNNVCNSCGACGMCGNNMGCCGWHGRHMRHSVLRWILGLIILGIVFSVGMKIGEFKGQIEAGWYGGMMSRGVMEYGGSPNMMYRLQVNSAPATTGTTGTAATPTGTK